MKKSRFTEVQVVQALQKHETDIPIGVKPRNVHRTRHLLQWMAKYGGLDVSNVQKLKTLKEDHPRLKRIYADLAMDNQLFRDLFSKKG